MYSFGTGEAVQTGSKPTV